jgi:hypothetical protein
MSLENLTEIEMKIVGECLNAVAFSQLFDVWEFETLFGLTRNEIKIVAENFPDVDELDDDSGLAINNTFNNLIGYPNINKSEWAKYISVGPGTVSEIYEKWKDT